jgi:hypothetical protein
VSPKSGRLLYLKQVPKVSSHPAGENSPNLVTLPGQFLWNTLSTRRGDPVRLVVASKRSVLSAKLAVPKNQGDRIGRILRLLGHFDDFFEELIFLKYTQ